VLTTRVQCGSFPSCRVMILPTAARYLRAILLLAILPLIAMLGARCAPQPSERSADMLRNLPSSIVITAAAG
jgi:hypothetical protein